MSEEMMSEEKLREAVSSLGYDLLKITHFKKHDRLRLKTPEGNILTLTLKDRIENIPLKYVNEWIGRK